MTTSSSFFIFFTRMNQCAMRSALLVPIQMWKSTFMSWSFMSLLASASVSMIRSLFQRKQRGWIGKHTNCRNVHEGNCHLGFTTANFPLFRMDLAYMCVKMRLFVKIPKHQMRLYVCHQMACVTKCVLYCVTKCVYMCVTKCGVSPNWQRSSLRSLTFVSLARSKLEFLSKEYCLNTDSCLPILV